MSVLPKRIRKLPAIKSLAPITFFLVSTNNVKAPMRFYQEIIRPVTKPNKIIPITVQTVTINPVLIK